MSEQNINVAQQDTLEAIGLKIDTINTNSARLTSTRAGYIDNIGATNNTGGTSTSGTVMAKLNKIISDIASFVGNWTATRAGYIDNIRSYTVTNNTASKTGVLSAKLAYVISLLENTTYGLSAIKSAISSSSGGGLKSVTKTYTNAASGTETGLTREQASRLYSVYINGTLKVNKVQVPVDSTAFRFGGGDSYGNGASMGIFMTHATYVAGYSIAYYQCGVNAETNRLQTAGPFTGSITYYYFG